MVYSELSFDHVKTHFYFYYVLPCLKKCSVSPQALLHKASELSKLMLHRCETCRAISHLHLNIFPFFHKILKNFTEGSLFVRFRLLLSFTSKWSGNFDPTKNEVVFHNYASNAKVPPSECETNGNVLYKCIVCILIYFYLFSIGCLRSMLDFGC